MLKVTEKALRSSIKKWEKIVKWIGEGKTYVYGDEPFNPEENYLEDECALCVRYTRGCKTKDGCPVYHKTEQYGCEGTYYWDGWKDDIKIAKKELAFLKRLLPKE